MYRLSRRFVLAVVGLVKAIDREHSVIILTILNIYSAAQCRVRIDVALVNSGDKDR